MTILPHQRQNNGPKCVIYGLRLRNEYEYRYIGLTTNGASYRFYHHLWNAHAKKINFPVYKWIRKYYMPGHVVCEVIEECDNLNIEELFFREQFWIAYYRENGYRLLNLSDGGQSLSGYKMPEELRLLKSISMSGKNNPMWGKSFSDAHRAAISRGLKGKPSNNKGRKFSEEHRKNISLNHHDVTGINNPFFGKNHDEKTKEKMKLASHNRWHVTRNILKPNCSYCEENK